MTQVVMDKLLSDISALLKNNASAFKYPWNCDGFANIIVFAVYGYLRSQKIEHVDTVELKNKIVSLLSDYDDCHSIMGVINPFIHKHLHQHFTQKQVEQK